MFSDIEGSTRHWEKQQAAMQQALAKHDAILREAIRANGGHLIKTTGDGALAAFSVASDAVAACLAAQRALEVHPWTGPRIRSRMALHTGTAEQREGDYYGPVLNRAARLMAAGHGGQILLSLATEELVRDQLPPGVALRDMGERRLKDLVRPERVFQVIAADLPAAFPPLKTLDERPNNLPGQTTTFIGREGMIRELKARLNDRNSRLLTLSGVAGTGKTRLALQVGAEMVDEFQDGIVYVPLATLRDPDLVLRTIAQTLGVRQLAGEQLQDKLQEYLRGKELLIVLDNFEQVIAAAPRIGEMLMSAPHVKVLVTSREVLRLSGEIDCPVPPLSLPDRRRLPTLARLGQYEAIALFNERAVAVKPDFAFTVENAGCVTEICTRLEGLPLAIELAAARLRVLPPQDILAELNHRLDFLVGGPRDVPARQKTLRAAIDWSHDLLNPVEMQLFRRMAVLVGGGTVDAITYVCGVEPRWPVLQTVESLVDKSLLKQAAAQDGARFLMLETVREYATERLLAAGEFKNVRDRHRDYFLAFAEDVKPKLLGAEQAEWLRRLDHDYDNLRAALEWSVTDPDSIHGLRLCGALDRFWSTRGHLSEGREWCRRALEVPAAQERSWERGNVLNTAGYMAYRQNDYDAARTLQEESLAIMRKLGDRQGISRSLNNLGGVAADQGDFASGRLYYEECLTLQRQLDDPNGTAMALNNLAIVVSSQGDFVRARSFGEESLAIRRSLGDTIGAASSLSNLAHLAYDQGDYRAARALGEESLDMRRKLGDRFGIAISLTNLGDVACAEGDWASAQALYREALPLWSESGGKLGIAFSLEGLAAVAAALGHPLRAASVWGAAERLRTEIGTPPPPNERAQYDQRVLACRAAVGDPAAFERAWGEGRGWTLERAIEIAATEAWSGSLALSTAV